MLQSAKSPFPGMNPYFEDTQHWRGFHNNCASEIVAQLIPQLDDSYAATVEVDLVIEGVYVNEKRRLRPDAIIVNKPDTAHSKTASAIATAPTARRTVLEILPEKLRRIVIKLAETDEVVTVIEILSPTNKRGEGLITYRKKRHDILLSDVHLIEIDLLRRGKRPDSEIDTEMPFEYTLVVNRTGMTRVSDIWHIALNDSLPNVPVPLLYPDDDVILDMNQIITQVYTRYGFSRLFDYEHDVPKPKLRPEIETWWQERKAALIVKR